MGIAIDCIDIASLRAMPHTLIPLTPIDHSPRVSYQGTTSAKQKDAPSSLRDESPPPNSPLPDEPASPNASQPGTPQLSASSKKGLKAMKMVAKLTPLVKRKGAQPLLAKSFLRGLTSRNNKCLLTDAMLTEVCQKQPDGSNALYLHLFSASLERVGRSGLEEHIESYPGRLKGPLGVAEMHLIQLEKRHGRAVTEAVLSSIWVGGAVCDELLQRVLAMALTEEARGAEERAAVTKRTQLVWPRMRRDLCQCVLDSPAVCRDNIVRIRNELFEEAVHLRYC